MTRWGVKTQNSHSKTGPMTGTKGSDQLDGQLKGVGPLQTEWNTVKGMGPFETEDPLRKGLSDQVHWEEPQRCRGTLSGVRLP